MRILFGIRRRARHNGNPLVAHGGGFIALSAIAGRLSFFQTTFHLGNFLQSDHFGIQRFFEEGFNARWFFLPADLWPIGNRFAIKIDEEVRVQLLGVFRLGDLNLLEHRDRGKHIEFESCCVDVL